MNRPKKLLLFFFRLCLQHVKERFALSGDGEQVGGQACLPYNLLYCFIQDYNSHSRRQFVQYRRCRR